MTRANKIEVPMKDESLNVRISVVEKTIDHICHTLNRIDLNLDKMDNRLDRMDSRLDRMDNRIDSLSTKLDSEFKHLLHRQSLQFGFLFSMIVGVLGILSHSNGWL